MKLLLLAASLMLVAIAFLPSCSSPEKKQEKLAKTHCSSCHSFPDPSLLDKKTWESSVLPKMAFRMGLDYSQLAEASEEDQPFVMQTLPDGPMISPEEWEAIKSYYVNRAPDSLPRPVLTVEESIKQFEVTTFQFEDKEYPMISLLEADTLNKNIYIGTRQGKLYKLDFNFKQKDLFKLPSAPSDMLFSDDGLKVLTMGIMDPNDQPKGSLNKIDEHKRTGTKLIDSLKRPAAIEEVDLNNDGLKDYVICAFGNYTGALLVYENLGESRFERHVLSQMPGARNVVIHDHNNDGLPDIIALMTQGDEQIIQFTNKGDFDFKTTSLLRFSPVYGSSYFDIADFNGDGRFDILYTNGDNADYSSVLKPYHGVRIFHGDGHDKFEEHWFYPMDGASKASARDFDEDGDLDIIAFSFFPDFMKTPERSLIYFENTGSGFKSHLTPLSTSGRWLVMEVTDIDGDRDSDVLLGALDFANIPNTALIDQWTKHPASILILRNKLR
jgi:hypothetical protein